MAPTEAPRLILASTSPYRRELLRRLHIPFECVAPGVDEAAAAAETPAQTAARLARQKCDAVAARHPDAVVIGSDQVAELEGRALGKPGNRANAETQLRDCSGRAVVFHTAVCLRHGESARPLMDRTTVQFRTLSAAEIGRYLELEQPYDCAGSFKVEGLGASLFDAVDSQDPTALVGLPLISLAHALRAFGYRVP